MKTIPAKEANPLACPICGEACDWEVGTLSNNRTIAEACTCGNCGGKWMNIFKMRDQVILEPGEEFPEDIEDD